MLSLVLFLFFPRKFRKIEPCDSDKIYSYKKRYVLSGAKPGIFEGKGGFSKLGHKFLTVLRDQITCKHFSALLSKSTISIKYK